MARLTKAKKKPSGKHLEGVISVTRKGVGYFSHDSLMEDLEIAPGELNTALHGDMVLVRPLRAGRAPGRPSKRSQGEVIKILNRKSEEFVGILIEENNRIYLKPDNVRFYTKIAIPKPPRDAKVGHKAVVKMETWTNPEENPHGEILEVLGKQGEHETEMRSIVRGHGFDLNFPPNVMREAEAIEKNKEHLAEEIATRRDFRNIITFTIDPKTAKDFDDAISIQNVGENKWEIGVHIADVSHYVRPNSAIDKEARKRATSIYLVDRTIPMLPEVLSNDVCSLNPHEDKLAYSAVFVYDKNGGVHERWFGKTAINSNKRFTYEEAQEVIDTGAGVHAEELKTLDTIAHALRKKRFEKGAIDFDQDEVAFELDENGKPIAVHKKERLNSMKLIEDLMLLANREVATYFQTLGKKLPESRRTFLYRIHDMPDPDRIEELGIFLRAIGYEFKTKTGAVSAKDLNDLFKEIEGTPEEHLIKVATIRSMAKAIYSTKNIGHFGLSFTYYTHFTSPIRRYPDVMVHRLLKNHLDNEPLSAKELAEYEALAIQSSQKEVEAVEAERDSIKYKQVEYMKEHVGEEFDGVITGVVDWGLYIEEVNTKAEGLLRISNLGGDFYELDKKNYRLVGSKTKQKYVLGDKVRVKLMGANLEEKTLEWKLVEQK